MRGDARVGHRGSRSPPDEAGCQVQALRAIEGDLGLEKLYVLGTNCVDNPRDGEVLLFLYRHRGGFRKRRSRDGWSRLVPLQPRMICNPPLQPIIIRCDPPIPCMSPRRHEALQRFLRSASDTPETAIGFEFMQDHELRTTWRGRAVS